MKEHYGFIYITTNLINWKQYIGQHKIKDQLALDPWYLGTGTDFKEAKKIYGKENFNRMILCFCESEEELDEKEKEYIEYFGATKNDEFYNCAEGGKHGGNLCAGKKPEEMEEIRKKISIKVSGENSPSYGVHRFGVYNGMDGIGENHPRAKQVYCEELNIIFSYIRQVEKYFNNKLCIKINRHHVCNVCRGKRKHAGKLTDGTKLTWKYVEDVDPDILKNAIICDYEE